MDWKELLSILNHFFYLHFKALKNGQFFKTVLRFEPLLLIRIYCYVTSTVFSCNHSRFFNFFRVTTHASSGICVAASVYSTTTFTMWATVWLFNILSAKLFSNQPTMLSNVGLLFFYDRIVLSHKSSCMVFQKSFHFTNYFHFTNITNLCGFSISCYNHFEQQLPCTPRKISFNRTFFLNCCQPKWRFVALTHHYKTSPMIPVWSLGWAVTTVTLEPFSRNGFFTDFSTQLNVSKKQSSEKWGQTEMGQSLTLGPFDCRLFEMQKTFLLIWRTI